MSMILSYTVVMVLDIGNAAQGEVVFISAQDYGLIKNYKWNINRQKRDGYTLKYVYAITGYHPSDRTINKKEYLHRMIMKPPKGFIVDHIDGNGLNNTRENLRVVSHSENQRNRRHLRTNSQSYKS